jgi:hypothetical protein
MIYCVHHVFIPVQDQDVFSFGSGCASQVSTHLIDHIFNLMLKISILKGIIELFLSFSLFLYTLPEVSTLWLF